MISLNSKQKQQLKAQAHSLKPVVLLGNQGLTPAVLAEIDRALLDHELIKIRIAGEDRDQRLQLAKQVCESSQATLIQMIGRIAILYRKNNRS